MNVFEQIKEKLRMKLNYSSGYPNCSEYDYAYECAMSDARKQVIEIVEQVEKQCSNCWIPCSERLPEEVETTDDIEEMIYEGNATEYIVMIQGAKKATTLYYAGGGYWYDEVSQEYYNVKAWKPLPEPYKESEKE